MFARHVAVQAGVGRKRAAEGARFLIRQFSPRALISFGFAGGLMPELVSGTLVIGTEVVCETWPAKVGAANCDLIQQFQAAADTENLPVYQGRLVSTLHPVSDPASKAAWWEKSGACAVDMETAGMVEVADEAGLPWVALRAIVDSAADCLPEACLTVLRANGHLAFGRLIGRLCRSPQLLRDFLRLANDTARARRHLLRTFEQWTKTQSAEGGAPE
jgi:nucleoside phosphorylase